MFDNLSSKITSAMRTLKGKGRITDVNVAATVKEIRRALMDADVNYKVAKELTDRIKDQAHKLIPHPFNTNSRNHSTLICRRAIQRG